MSQKGPSAWYREQNEGGKNTSGEVTVVVQAKDEGGLDKDSGVEIESREVDDTDGLDTKLKNIWSPGFLRNWVNDSAIYWECEAQWRAMFVAQPGCGIKSLYLLR